MLTFSRLATRFSEARLPREVPQHRREPALQRTIRGGRLLQIGEPRLLTQIFGEVGVGHHAAGERAHPGAVVEQLFRGRSEGRFAHDYRSLFQEGRIGFSFLSPFDHKDRELNEIVPLSLCRFP